MDSTAGTKLDAESKKAADDFAKLIAVSRLGPIEESDLYEWFDELEVPDSPPGRRSQLALRAMKDPVSGNLDGTPLHVFERLKSEQLWASNPFAAHAPFWRASRPCT